MKRNELTDLVWKLQREFMECEPKVEISFKALEYGYGLITPELLTGRYPELSELRACATKSGSDIHSTELRIVSLDGSTIEIREVDWPTADCKQEAVECSKHSAVVYFQRRYSGTVERLVSWDEVQHLMVTDNEIYLGEVNLATANTWMDAFDLSVLIAGSQIAPDQFHWLPPAHGRILEALLNMLESVFNSGDGLTMQNGFQTLVEEPRRWAAVVREFISRHGRPQAEALLGREALDHIMAGRSAAFALIPASIAANEQLKVALNH